MCARLAILLILILILIFCLFSCFLEVGLNRALQKKQLQLARGIFSEPSVERMTVPASSG